MALGRYSAKCGIPRYLRILNRHGIAATVFIPGYDAERNPGLVREIAALGYLHESHDIGPGEADLLRRSHDILTGITGTEPRGWRSPSGRKSAATVRTLMDLGYHYDSSDKDHDYPYLGRVDGRDVGDYMFLPNNTSSLDDDPFFDLSLTPPSEVLTHWKQEFDAIHREGGYYNLIIHPRLGYGLGSPAKARIVDELITYIRQFPDAAFVRLDAAEEFDLLARAHEVLIRIAGTAPVGWCAPEGRMSTATLRHLAKPGYRYDSSFQDDDFPYYLQSDGGGEMIELPQNPMLIDATIYRAWQPHDRLARHWQEEFDAAVDEGCFCCPTLHGRSDYGSGRASRIAVAEAFLTRVLKRGIPVKRCADMI